MIKKIIKSILLTSLIFGITSCFKTNAAYINLSKFTSQAMENAKVFGGSPFKLKDDINKFINGKKLDSMVTFKKQTSLLNPSKLMNLKCDNVARIIYVTLGANLDFENEDHTDDIFLGIPDEYQLLIKKSPLLIKKTGSKNFTRKEVKFLNISSRKYIDEDSKPGIPFHCRTNYYKAKTTKSK